MHFFTEPNKIISQGNSFSYGPIIGEEQTKFSTGTSIEVNAVAKVFACQESMMIVQPHKKSDGTVHPDLVNIILKPVSGLGIPFSTIKYFLYRGVSKSSMISGSAITPSNTSSTEFITKFWQRWNQFKTDTSQPGLTDPTPQSFGFDDTLPETTLLEEIYNSEASSNTEINDLQAIKVLEGEWIGDIPIETEFNFEVITDTDHLILDLAYARKFKNIVDVSDLADNTPQEKFTLKAEKEKILNYVDPVALFGMFYNLGIKVSTFSGNIKNTVTKNTSELYSEILDKFISKNRVYLDIRSERGYNYNYYENYGDTNNIILKQYRKYGGTTSVVRNFVYSDWPILWLDSPTGTITDDTPFNYIELQLRVDDNLKPLLFIENPKLLGDKNIENFVEETDLLDSSNTEWTKKIKVQYPNYNTTGAANGTKLDVAHHIKLQYFRQEDNSASPNTVLKSENYLDSAFGGIHFPAINVPTIFLNEKKVKKHLNNSGYFQYVTENSLITDTNYIVFLTRNGNSLKKSQNTYPRIDFSQFQSNNIIQNYILPENLIYNKWKINDGSNTIDILDIVGYNKINPQPIPIEDIFIIGLTKAEWQVLDTISGISDLHQKYLLFEEMPNQADVNTGTPYKKYKLKIQGFNNFGVATVIAPTIDIFAYGTSLNLLASKDFGNNTSIPNLIPDPGTYKNFQKFGYFKYDETDSDVISLFPTNPKGINDVGNNLGLLTIENKLIADVFFPSIVQNTTDVADIEVGSFPLIIIIHGNGHHYYDYKTLSQHLALNGFIVVAINCLIEHDKFSLNPINPFIDNGITYDKYFSIDDTYFYSSTSNSISKYDHSLNILTNISWTSPADFSVNGNVIEFVKLQSSQGMAPLARANLLYPHLQIIKKKFGNSVDNNIGIMGHSRGGEAVVRVAKDITSINDFPIMNPSLRSNPTWKNIPSGLDNIKAIISLAPTDLWEEENLIQPIPYFVMYGSKDGDVSGLVSSLRLDGSSKIVGTGGFSLYDRTINNEEKSMAFVYGATHNGFITDNHDYPDPTVKLEYLTTQYAISKAYINSFFRMNLKNERLWLPIFSESFIPNSINKTDIYLQYQNLSDRNLIADFNNITPTDLLTLVSADSGFNFKKTEYNLRGNYPNFNYNNREDPFSPHFFDGLFIEYPANGGKVTINIPLSKKDASNYNFLSFRICHVSGTYQNTPRDEYTQLFSSYNDLSKLAIELEDLTASKHHVYIKKIPIPDERILTVQNNLPVNRQGWTDYPMLTKSALITIRIPFQNYINNGLDISNLSKISFIFPSHTSGGFLDIDDIEYTN